MVRRTYPQSGDSADEADLLSAEGLAFLNGQRNNSEFVETGLNITNLDFLSEPKTFDISTGKAYTLVDTLSTNGEAWLLCQTAAQFNAGTHELIEGALNYVFAWFKRDVNDSGEIRVNTTGVPPSEDSLLVATVDPDASPTLGDAVTPQNTAPDGVYEALRADVLDVETISIGNGEFSAVPLTSDNTIPRTNQAYDHDDGATRSDGNPKRKVRSSHLADIAGRAIGLDDRLYRAVAEYVEEFLKQRNKLYKWTHIATDSNDTPGQDEVTVMEVPRFDEYRIHTFSENHSPDHASQTLVGVNDYGQGGYFQLTSRVGGRRARPDFEHRNDAGHIDANERGAWDIMSLPPATDGRAESVITRPRPHINSRSVNRYPSFSSVYRATGVQFGNVTMHGILEEHATWIRTIRMRCEPASTAKWTIEGRNLPWNSGIDLQRRRDL